MTVSPSPEAEFLPESPIRELLRPIKHHFQEWTYPARARLYRRRFQAFGIGAPKSGTHSLAGLFRSNYASRHEPQREALLDLIFAAAEGKVSSEHVRRQVIKHDRRLCLELESSHLNFFFLEHLVREFPNALFILTLRECTSWLNSIINSAIRNKRTRRFARLETLRYGSTYTTFPPQERLLQERGLFPLDGYLSWYKHHTQTVVEVIPPERLLIIRTHELGKSIPQLAAFLDIPPDSLDTSSSHLYKTPVSYRLLEKIDHHYLQTKIQEHCGTVMEKYFPDMHGP